MPKVQQDIKKSGRISQRKTAKVKVETITNEDLGGEKTAEIIDAAPINHSTSNNALLQCNNPPPMKMRVNKYGESPLHVAVKRGDIEKVKSLLSDGWTEVNSKDNGKQYW